MADLNFILQAVTKANHAESIRVLLRLAKPTQILVSVAFARTNGVDAIEAGIKPLAAKTKVFVGIRNDITSIQAVTRLLGLKLDLYAVDTGSRQTIFHPKLYIARNATNAIGIIGSANMTFSGLYNNIEVSTSMALDLSSNPGDKAFLDAVLNAFDKMLVEHPKHVFKIKDEKHAERLFEEGRLADETVILAPSSGSSVRKGERDNLLPMKLTRVSRPKSAKAKFAATGAPVLKGKAAAAKQASVLLKPVLVWESKPLSRRDLTIPTSAGTNQTGSMGLKQGLYDHIDQRHYFYDEVFADLQWIPDQPGSKKLHATAKFELVIKNISYGVFNLIVSHDTNTQSASYIQSNMMTHLHWGDARSFIAKEDLLHRNLYLYRKEGAPPEFAIEID